MRTPPYPTCGTCRRYCSARTAVGPEVVPGGNDLGPVLVVVGQDPGRQEDQQGRPWVGPSGSYVRLLVDAVYDQYSRIVLTNALRCISDHTPTKEEILMCSPNLLKDLETTVGKPRVVLACGRVAESALRSLGVEAIYVPHPSTCLRSGIPRHRWVSDVVAKIPFGKPPAFELVEAEEDPFPGTEVLSVDAEFTDLQSPYVISVSDGKKVAYYTRENFHLLPRVLDGKTVLAHNAVVEHVVLDGLGVKPASYVDTLALVRYYDDRLAGDLKSVGKYLLGYHYTRPNLKSGEATDEVVHYNACDAVVAYHLYDRLSLMGAGGDSLIHRALLQDLIPLLADMYKHGIKVDRQKVQEEKERLIAESEEILSRLGRYAPINWRSTQQVKEYFESVTGKSLPSVDKLVLSELDLEEAKLLLEYRSREKLLSTYIKPMEGVDRVHALLNLSGTETGRLSFLDGTVNIQTIPDSLRGVFIPDEGHVWVKADYSTHEVRVLAWLAESPVLRTNVDDWAVEPRPISWMLEHEDPYDAISYVYSPYVSDKKLLRDVTKMTFLAMMYGAGARRIHTQAVKMGVQVSYEEVQEVLNKLKSVLVSVERLRRYMSDISGSGDSREIRWPPLWRRRKFLLRDSASLEEFRKALINTPTQGAAADICTLAALEISKRYRVLNILHDEIDVQVPEDEVDEAVTYIKECMLFRWAERVQLFTHLPNLKVSVAVGRSWADAS